MRYALTAMAAVSLVSFAMLGHASAQAPTVDEAYTFYKVESHTFMDGETPSAEWFLKASLRVFGNIPERSILKYAIKKGARTLGQVRCETRSRYNRVTNDYYPHVFAEDCHQRDLYVRELGEVNVEWTLINGDTDAETVVANHTIFIRRAPNFDPGSTPPRPWYPSFYVDRHSEVLSTVLWQHPNRNQGSNQGFMRYFSNVQSYQAGNSVDIIFNASPEWGANNVLRGAHTRCSVDGNRVDLRAAYNEGNTSGTRTDEVSVTDTANSYAQATIPNPNGDNPRVVQDHYVFRRYVALMPLTFGPRAEQRRNATQMTPGRWECDLRNDQGLVLRTFRWTVGADGNVAAHAEMGQGLTLSPGATFIETVVPQGNPLDFRTDPSALSRAFNGRGLRSEPARALVSGVPQIGTPYPAEPRRAVTTSNNSNNSNTKGRRRGRR